MPTTPDQDGSFFDSVGIQRPRTGPVGVPRTGGMAAPTSVPPRPPSIPGAGAQPGGRPVDPGPAGSGVGAAAQPAPAAAPTGAPSGAPSVQINMPGATQPAAPGAPAPAPGAAPLTGMPQAAATSKMPTRRELDSYPPGTQFETPYGPVVTNPTTGRRSVRLTPEGQMLYARDQQAMRAKMAPNPFNADPNAPKPEVVPGRLFFDPFGGGYVS